MESSQTTTILDRLHDLESQNDELRTKVDRLSKRPGMYLMPHTNYTVFSDGMLLCWHLRGDPEMIDAYGERSALDDLHWSAVVFPGKTNILFFAEIGFERRTPEIVVRVGWKNDPVTLRVLVDVFHDVSIAKRVNLELEKYMGDTYCGFTQVQSGTEGSGSHVTMHLER